jgi:hypothetical protein
MLILPESHMYACIMLIFSCVVFSYLLQLYPVNFYLVMCWTCSLGLYYRLWLVQPIIQTNTAIKRKVRPSLVVGANVEVIPPWCPNDIQLPADNWWSNRPAVMSCWGCLILSVNTVCLTYKFTSVIHVNAECKWQCNGGTGIIYQLCIASC